MIDIIHRAQAITTLSILCARGDIKLTWDHGDLAEADRARKEIHRLQEAENKATEPRRLGTPRLGSGMRC